MERRPGAWRNRLWALLAGTMLALPAAGCGFLLSGMYLMGAGDTPAECDGLKGKRVAIVCRPTPSIEYSAKRSAGEISRMVGAALQKQVRGLKLVPQRKVDEWIDENDWEDEAELGKAVDAERIVVIELDRLSLYQGQTLYQGQCKYDLRVYDVENGGSKLVFDTSPEPIVYPPSTGISTADKTEQQFRSQFLRIIAGRISRHFFPFDHRTEFAIDSTALSDE